MIVIVVFVRNMQIVRQFTDRISICNKLCTALLISIIFFSRINRTASSKTSIHTLKPKGKQIHLPLLLTSKWILLHLLRLTRKNNNKFLPNQSLVPFNKFTHNEKKSGSHTLSSAKIGSLSTIIMPTVKAYESIRLSCNLWMKTSTNNELHANRIQNNRTPKEKWKKRIYTQNRENKIASNWTGVLYALKQRAFESNAQPIIANTY